MKFAQFLLSTSLLALAGCDSCSDTSEEFPCEVPDAVENGDAQDRLGEFTLATSSETDFFVLSPKEVRFGNIEDAVYASSLNVVFDANGQLVTLDDLTPVMFLVNSDGSAASTSLSTSELIRVQSDGNPVATREVAIDVNLPTDAEVLAPIPNPADFDGMSGFSGLTAATSATVFDSLGETHSLSVGFALVDADTHTWHVFSKIDETSLLAATPMILDFDPEGNLDIDDADADGVLTTGGGTLVFDPYTLDNGAADLTLSLNFANQPSSTSTSIGDSFEVRLISPNGAASESLSRFQVNNTGLLTVIYTSGREQMLGRLALAKFPSPANLTRLSEGRWQQSEASGEPRTGVALTENFDAVEPVTFNY